MINTKYIEDRLKEYKEKESNIENTLARVRVYEDAINNPGSFTHIHLAPSLDMGMPKGKGGRPNSPVESAIKEGEETKEEAIETLKEWIREEKSRIYPLQIEKEQIDGALNALTTQQKFIIKCKYFEDMMWRDIEYDFNDEFRQKNYITVEGLRKLNRQALKLITKILQPYYTRFKI